MRNSIVVDITGFIFLMIMFFIYRWLEGNFGSWTSLAIISPLVLIVGAMWRHKYIESRSDDR